MQKKINEGGLKLFLEGNHCLKILFSVTTSEEWGVAKLLYFLYLLYLDIWGIIYKLLWTFYVSNYKLKPMISNQKWQELGPKFEM